MILRYLLILFLGVASMGLIGCSVRTPEIQGVVLDEQTKQPVPDAWISATIGIKNKTVAGDVGQVISLDPPHTRTDKNGEFVIPLKKIKKPPFPVSFGTEVGDVGIGARTVDDKGGGMEFKGEKLKEFLKKNKSELTIFVKPVGRNEAEYFSHLQSLYRYCRDGRFGIEVPPVEGGCDKWELDYAIAKHERYLEKYKRIIEERGYSTAFDQLAYLYDKKSDYGKAIQTLTKSITIMEAKGLLKFEVWQRNRREIEQKIYGLQQKLEGVKK